LLAACSNVLDAVEDIDSAKRSGPASGTPGAVRCLGGDHDDPAF
jgi:hypothetical protein